MRTLKTIIGKVCRDNGMTYEHPWICPANMRGDEDCLVADIELGPEWSVAPVGGDPIWVGKLSHDGRDDLDRAIKRWLRLRAEAIAEEREAEEEAKRRAG